MATTGQPATPYRISSQSFGAVELNASSWLVALAGALELWGILDLLHQLACEVLPNGRAIIRVLRSEEGTVDSKNSPQESLLQDSIVVELLSASLSVSIPVQEGEVLEAPGEEEDASVIADRLSGDRAEAAMQALAMAEALVRCEGGAILGLLEDDSMEFVAASGPFGQSLVKHRIPRRTGFAGFCVAVGTAINSQEPYRDARFYPDVDAITGGRTRSILCAPIRVGREVLGSIELINAQEGSFPRHLTHELEKIADALGQYWRALG